ncbi:MAG: hypothetical protein UY76_C0010G0011 [Candidatus Uhrbacteria bacterium GW2011_GWA2_52_8d]|uniref:Uncharacterized protein n=1 Tax=Candidatus Uhrbacteria bacterium GW2011_GWA2_52_8d TaxID=1618979 RepID=A0A0G2AKA3_9BACT|nr:MAG: hypothetical protein UY76_C0010G0011 [Candidatus Uhrbacteria bacterium GW2011_GWA2_52_8d]
MRSFFIICALVWATFASAQEAHVCEMAWENLTSDVWEGGWLDPHALDSQGCAQLRYLSRAVYARHGYHEDNSWFVLQFKDDPRFVMDLYVTSHTVQSMLTPADRANLEVVNSAEQSLACDAWWMSHPQAQQQNVAPVRVLPSWQVDPVAPVADDVPAWQRQGASIPMWQQKEPTLPAYAKVEIVAFPVMDNSRESVTIVSGEATPEWLGVRALGQKGIENEWLTPLTCDELRLVEEALYVQHGFNSPMLAQMAVIVQAQMVPAPIHDLTREGAEHFFTSQDKLTKLRVDRAQTQNGCMEAK